MLRKVHYQAQNQAAYKIHNKRSQGESKSTALDPPTDPISQYTSYKTTNTDYQPQRHLLPPFIGKNFSRFENICH